MTNSDTLQKTDLYNYQPKSHTSKSRVFPSLPYSPENLKFINKFNFHFSDLTNTDYVTLPNTKHVMLPIKMMLERLQRPFALDLNQMLNFLHNDLLKYQSITVINSTIFLKN